MHDPRVIVSPVLTDLFLPLTAGWGNLGAGVTQLVVGSILFPIFKILYDGDAEMAWRTVCVVPACFAFYLGIVIYCYTDDCPKGNFSEMKQHGCLPPVSAVTSFRAAAANYTTWVLFIQYACCFGVELTMNNAAALYFEEKFDLETESAAVVASIFSWMNLFARGIGGFVSDAANESMGMRGRILAQTLFLVGEGILVIIFSSTESLVSAIMTVLVFSLFVQACEGTSYGIVPYIVSEYTGSVSGIVGAGGNAGAVVFGLCFRELDYPVAFTIMGLCILGSAVLSIWINIEGHSSLLWGEDVPAQPDIGEAPRLAPREDVPPTMEISF